MACGQKNNIGKRENEEDMQKDYIWKEIKNIRVKRVCEKYVPSENVSREWKKTSMKDRNMRELKKNCKYKIEYADKNIVI